MVTDISERARIKAALHENLHKSQSLFNETINALALVEIKNHKGGYYALEVVDACLILFKKGFKLEDST